MNKLKFGIIGAGRIGKLHAENLTYNIPNAEVVAIADVNLNAAQETAQNLGIPQVSDQYKDIISNVNVDVVAICSPTDLHAQQIIESAEAGKHIFCEKPIALSIDKIQEANEAVKQNGVKLMVGFNRRFDANFAKIQQTVAAHKTGSVHIVKITSRDPAPPPVEYVKRSGGLFLDMMIHDFDMSRYVSGSEVEEVYATGNVLVDPKIGEAGDIDTAIVQLKFKNGALGVIDNSRQAVYGYDQRVEVFGNNGMVLVDNNKPDAHRFLGAEGETGSLPLYFFLERYAQSYINEMNAFIKSILEDSSSPVTGQDGLMAVVIGLAANKSLKENRPVKTSEILEQYQLVVN